MVFIQKIVVCFLQQIKIILAKGAFIMACNKIITIGRQFGSGGREVAEILAKKMQVRCYDRQIVYLAAEKIGNGDLDVESILEEAYKVPGSHSGFFGGLGIGSDVIPDYNKMYKEQAALIHRLADKFGGVFLGRCADAVLADTPDCYHIFIYADDAFREKRSKEAYEGISLKEMDKEDVSRQRYYNYYTGKRIDRERRDYYRYYTGKSWENLENYDLMINTGKIDLEDAADLIIDYIEKVQSE